MRRARHRARVRAAKAEGCATCGYAGHENCLEFHHLDGRDRNVKRFHELRDVGLDRFLAEARLCVVLCAICHTLVESDALCLLPSIDTADIIHERNT